MTEIKDYQRTIATCDERYFEKKVTKLETFSVNAGNTIRKLAELLLCEN